MKKLSFFLILLLSTVLRAEDYPKLYILNVEGVIDPVIVDYVKEGIEEAELNKADALMIVLDTPGGLLESTRKIIKDMLNTTVPIIVYVAPKGARAASAGVFITMASDIAAMAPLTHIGAAHPVSIGSGLPLPKPQGEKPKDDLKKEDLKKEDGGSEEPAEDKKPKGSVMEQKVLADTVAYMENLAREKGRNWEWAVQAVKESVSITANEAKKKNVIEHLADSIEELLGKIEGKEILKNNKKTILNLKNAIQVEFPMSAFKKFLHTIANPNIAYLLLVLGFYGLVYEFSSPGIGFGAVVGIISLLFAFYALQMLPVSYVGLLLLVTGIILMLLDLKVVSNGILTIGGVVAFVLGSLFLIDSSEKYLRISGGMIAGVAIVTVAFIVFAMKKVIETHFTRPSTGKEGLIGEEGEAREELNPAGMVYVHGEYWQAVCDEVCAEGETVRIKRVEHNKLKVEKVKKTDKS